MTEYEDGYESGFEAGREAPQEVVRTAIAQIQRGDTLDAITTLEREFFPKWASVEASAAAYLYATRPWQQEAAGKPAAGAGEKSL